MYKIYLTRLAYTFLLFPTCILLITLFVRLFYVCENVYLINGVLISAVLLAWFASKKLLKYKWSSGIATLLFSVSVIYGLILISTNLISTNNVRPSGPDAGIKQALSNIRSQAEILYDLNSFSYDGVCDDDGVKALGEYFDTALHHSSSCYGPIFKMIIPKKISESSHFKCHDSANGYAAEAYLSSSKTYFCVDSTGFGGASKYSIGTSTKCAGD